MSAKATPQTAADPLAEIRRRIADIRQCQYLRTEGQTGEAEVQAARTAINRLVEKTETAKDVDYLKRAVIDHASDLRQHLTGGTEKYPTYHELMDVAVELLKRGHLVTTELLGVVETSTLRSMLLSAGLVDGLIEYHRHGGVNDLEVVHTVRSMVDAPQEANRLLEALYGTFVDAPAVIRKEWVALTAYENAGGWVRTFYDSLDVPTIERALTTQLAGLPVGQLLWRATLASVLKVATELADRVSYENTHLDPATAHKLDLAIVAAADDRRKHHTADALYEWAGIAARDPGNLVVEAVEAKLINNPLIWRSSAIWADSFDRDDYAALLDLAEKLYPGWNAPIDTIVDNLPVEHRDLVSDMLARLVPAGKRRTGQRSAAQAYVALQRLDPQPESVTWLIGQIEERLTHIGWAHVAAQANPSSAIRAKALEHVLDAGPASAVFAAKLLRARTVSLDEIEALTETIALGTVKQQTTAAADLQLMLKM